MSNLEKLNKLIKKAPQLYLNYEKGYTMEQLAIANELKEINSLAAKVRQDAYKRAERLDKEENKMNDKHTFTFPEAEDTRLDWEERPKHPRWDNTTMKEIIEVITLPYVEGGYKWESFNPEDR